MTLYILTEYEVNRYHDSYFHAILFDSEKLCVIDKEIGATAYSGGCDYSDFHYPTLEILNDVANSRKASLFELFSEAEKNRVFSFNSINPDVRVKTTKTTKKQIKKKVPCSKCTEKPGFWINPKDVCDQRTCFGCYGTGFCELKEPEKDENSKILFERISEGSCGKVLRTSSFGRFYRNGYNEPNRSNTTVLVLLDDGRSVWIPMSNLRLECEPDSPEQIYDKVNAYANNHCGFRSDSSRNYVCQLLNSTNKWQPGSLMNG